MTSTAFDSGSPLTHAPGGGPIPFRNTYARLSEHLYARTNPAPVAAPRLLQLNRPLAAELGMDAEWLESAEATATFAGNHIPAGAEPIALAYAGHQFGHFVPQLGDGRANLLGEVPGPGDATYDIQLKGSGRTPWSRGGDGRATLGPVLREYLVSEFMHAVHIPTTRALAAVATGETVMRERPLPGAILTRVAASHLRVGTFQYFAARGDTEAVRTLTHYALARHYPGHTGSSTPARTLLDQVVSRHARLVAQWMLVGFVHGVMNTDNTSISGETIDYGPCAFMEQYDPAQVFSSIDHHGRYAYSNQPLAAQWNLMRLAESLFELLKEEAAAADPGLSGEDKEQAAIQSAQDALAAFEPQFAAARLEGLRAKLGLLTQQEQDLALAEDLLTRMAQGRADFTLTFHLLTGAASSASGDVSLRRLFADPAAFDEWAGRWRERLAQEPDTAADRVEKMRAANPAFIPRNHHLDAALNAAIEDDNFDPWRRMLAAAALPFFSQQGLEDLQRPAEVHERITQTFCGT